MYLKHLHRGAICRVADTRRVSEDVRGQRVTISSIRGDGFVTASVRTGPAKGAKRLLGWDDVTTCSAPRVKGKKRRTRR